MRKQPQVRRESGYAYLMALFMVLALLIASQVAMQNLLTQGRREREAELVWRGQQFVRAIRLYYKKTGHYPQNLEQLKKGMPELNFLRYAAYKDPLKKEDDEDGGWRFIYVNAGGQIIGSVKYATLQQMALMDMNGGKLPGVKTGDQSDQPGVPVSSLADQSNSNGNSNSSSNQNNSNSSNQTASQNQSNSAGANTQATTPPAGTAPLGTDNSSNTAGVGAQQQPNQNSTAPTPSNTLGTPAGLGAAGLNTNLNNQSLAALAALKPTGPVSGPQLGAFLTGVASSVDKPSIRFYNGGKKYIQWEFIWNPVEDQAKAVQQGLNNPQGALPGQPGQAIGNGAAGTSIFGNPGGAIVTGGPGGPPATGPNGSTGTAPQQNSPQFGQSPQ